MKFWRKFLNKINSEEQKAIEDCKLVDETIHIFTDGACSGNPGQAACGAVLIYNGNIKKISENIGIATNNIAELEAFKIGLNAVKNKKLATIIYSDSQYVIGLLTLEWRAKENVKLVEDLKETTRQFANLKIKKVAGHSNVYFNELADKLAKKAIINK